MTARKRLSKRGYGGGVNIEKTRGIIYRLIFARISFKVQFIRETAQNREV